MGKRKPTEDEKLKQARSVLLTAPIWHEHYKLAGLVNDQLDAKVMKAVLKEFVHHHEQAVALVDKFIASVPAPTKPTPHKIAAGYFDTRSMDAITELGRIVESFRSFEQPNMSDLDRWAKKVEDEAKTLKEQVDRRDRTMQEVAEENVSLEDQLKECEREVKKLESSVEDLELTNAGMEETLAAMGDLEDVNKLRELATELVEVCERPELARPGFARELKEIVRVTGTRRI